MGATKTEIHEYQDVVTSQYAKVLGHPARIAILRYLISTSGCIGNELVDHIPLSQATISQHLKELKKMNLIQGTVQGNRIRFCINPQGWNFMKDLLSTLIETPIPENPDC